MGVARTLRLPSVLQNHLPPGGLPANNPIPREHPQAVILPTPTLEDLQVHVNLFAVTPITNLRNKDPQTKPLLHIVIAKYSYILTNPYRMVTLGV